jgi:hypothetical protein
MPIDSLKARFQTLAPPLALELAIKQDITNERITRNANQSHRSKHDSYRLLLRALSHSGIAMRRVIRYDGQLITLKQLQEIKI